MLSKNNLTLSRALDYKGLYEIVYMDYPIYLNTVTYIYDQSGLAFRTR